MPDAMGADFARTEGLAELLGGAMRTPVQTALTTLLGSDWALLDAAGQPLMGQHSPAQQRHLLQLQGEPVGYLCSNQAPAGLAALVQLLLQSVQRYRMAVEVHEAAVAEDYQELQRQHAALARSEQRYRELAGQLEERVKEQVRTIEQAQRQLFQAEKMASVGQLAAGMAHEINNPIGFTTSNLQTGQRYLRELGDCLREWRQLDPARAGSAWAARDLDFVLEDFDSLLHESLQGLGRVADIVAKLRAFAAVDRLPTEEADLNECLRCTAELMATQLAKGQRLELQAGPICRVRGDPAQLNQVLLSLVQNAQAALGDRGQIWLRSGRDAQHVWVEVEDNGCGMDEATCARIFDPFFTTREVGQGTGLGLTVSRDLVQSLGGRIEVRSAPGQGARFRIWLPVPAQEQP